MRRLAAAGGRSLLRTLGLFVALLLVAVVTGLAYLGAFASVEVEERAMGPFRFVYRTLDGADPRRVGEITEQVGNALRAAGVMRIRPFDVYYPEEASTPNEIGWEVAEEHFQALTALDLSFLQRTIPAKPCMVARFPWKHPLSFVVGLWSRRRAARAPRGARLSGRAGVHAERGRGDRVHPAGGAMNAAPRGDR